MAFATPANDKKNANGRFLVVPGSRRIGRIWPFGRMGIVIWVILGFRSQKCEHVFSGTQLLSFSPQTIIFATVLDIAACFSYGIVQRCSCLTHLIIREAALAADLITVSNLCPLEAALAADLEPFAFFLSFAGSVAFPRMHTRRTV